jgi:hypothetical protein
LKKTTTNYCFLGLQSAKIKNDFWWSSKEEEEKLVGWLQGEQLGKPLLYMTNLVAFLIPSCLAKQTTQ